MKNDERMMKDDGLTALAIAYLLCFFYFCRLEMVKASLSILTNIEYNEKTDSNDSVGPFCGCFHDGL
jgi:hypothetical protein